MSPWRKDAIAELCGRVLEVGVGTGANIPVYSDVLDVTVIDFSRNMLEKARAKFGHRRNVTFMEMDAQDLRFPDNTFDCVLTTCVFFRCPSRSAGCGRYAACAKPVGRS